MTEPEFAPVVELSIPEEPEPEPSFVDPEDEAPRGLPQLSGRPTPSAAPREEIWSPESGPVAVRAAEDETDDEALQRARRLIAAIGGGPPEAPLPPAAMSESPGRGGGGSKASSPEVSKAPVTLSFPPEPKGLPPAHTGYVVNQMMDLVEPVDAQEVESPLDGSTLLRM